MVEKRVLGTTATNLERLTLIVKNEKITREMAEKILRELSDLSAPVEALRITDSYFEPGIFAYLASRLQPNERLTLLSLHGNDYQDEESATIIINLLRVLGSLRVFEGEYNLGDHNVEAIADLVMGGMVLTKLGLTNGGVGNVGAAAIARVLRTNRSLVDLFLEENEIREEGAVQLAEAIRDNDTLDSLYINENPMGLVGYQAILEAAMDNPRIGWIDAWWPISEQERVIGLIANRNRLLREFMNGTGKVAALVREAYTRAQPRGRMANIYELLVGFIQSDPSKFTPEERRYIGDLVRIREEIGELLEVIREEIRWRQPRPTKRSRVLAQPSNTTTQFIAPGLPLPPGMPMPPRPPGILMPPAILAPSPERTGILEDQNRSELARPTPAQEEEALVLVPRVPFGSSS